MPEPVARYPVCTNCNENCPRSNLFKCIGQNCNQIFCWACYLSTGFPIGYDVRTGKMICPLCSIRRGGIEFGNN